MKLTTNQKTIIKCLKSTGSFLTTDAIYSEILWSKELIFSTLISLERLGIIFVKRRKGVNYYSVK
ncbi:MAG: hypothetical protein AAGJ08_25105 [Cyanobacteria bacterium P01_H01_bin.35]